VADVIEKCRAAVKEMYPPSTGADGAVQEGGVALLNGDVVKPVGADATLWDSLQEVGKKREAPVVKAFERLSLLG
jgi:elongator complex protein 1